jgi:hypothetical protein
MVASQDIFRLDLGGLMAFLNKRIASVVSLLLASLATSGCQIEGQTPTVQAGKPVVRAAKQTAPRTVSAKPKSAAGQQTQSGGY